MPCQSWGSFRFISTWHTLWTLSYSNRHPWKSSLYIVLGFASHCARHCMWPRFLFSPCTMYIFFPFKCYQAARVGVCWTSLSPACKRKRKEKKKNLIVNCDINWRSCVLVGIRGIPWSEIDTTACWFFLSHTTFLYFFMDSQLYRAECFKISCLYGMSHVYEDGWIYLCAHFKSTLNPIFIFSCAVLFWVEL